ncbi:MAG: hypothetical protein A2268_05705 [Candidatus Raymondbacteria bacterium RifOxyA12_full_50_37]|uniref:SpoVT-AbrB domain-containing protein n=1 Tax=Candidatus Raymondbacteria bacterium RIFOXYD12_FULL_49_13 TaxID=1817890 RepID=A0A1F7FFQ4_UNCRA|nr:MAG: hypothetical protein A2268_05705 [Candidatus Raymondbacteria bacterium RifOxyA12_full_50_37]OGJ94240.1 MAG: hypothetical protein A2248_14640 [Candidatus Raymondbacteria bacterium RIFOXYA2_FULL_49_16]OGJ98142.1 MAG: hypothetical protein A2350_01555 [Candidatus Raymondbacteria bacterium RifOxyB12_full_50_8]OGJ99070.1 MAG: hypothetical protein A2453_11050 [Candidatus Raymondbacteria bacterium RIFOXYC2_FULL_50_21]OGK05453.1 MAG: hypothetical protein A2519_03410 [Candidatus Raymondbacteria b
MFTKVQKWGNSLAIRLPRTFIEETHLSNGAVVDMTVEKGKIIVEPKTAKKYSLTSLLKAVTSTNIHREIRTGKAVGKEIW